MSNYRYMRSILMFDLPVDTAKQRRSYRQFVKFLKKNGFIMFQESIYIKLSVNSSAVESITKKIEEKVPGEGNVSMLTITEKQFNDMKYFQGEFKTDIINSDERTIEL